MSDFSEEDQVTEHDEHEGPFNFGEISAAKTKSLITRTFPLCNISEPVIDKMVLYAKDCGIDALMNILSSEAIGRSLIHTRPWLGKKKEYREFLQACKVYFNFRLAVEK